MRRFLFILVVESDDFPRQKIGRYLGQRGFFVMSASSVSLARELAAENDFDAVVAPLVLTDGSDCNLMGELKDTPGVSISLYGDSFERFKSKRLGFRAHLVAPVVLERLVCKISEISR